MVHRVELTEIAREEGVSCTRDMHDKASSKLSREKHAREMVTQGY